MRCLILLAALCFAAPAAAQQTYQYSWNYNPVTGNTTQRYSWQNYNGTYGYSYRYQRPVYVRPVPYVVPYYYVPRRRTWWGW